MRQRVGFCLGHDWERCRWAVWKQAMVVADLSDAAIAHVAPRNAAKIRQNMPKMFSHDKQRQSHGFLTQLEGLCIHIGVIVFSMLGNCRARSSNIFRKKGKCLETRWFVDVSVNHRFAASWRRRFGPDGNAKSHNLSVTERVRRRFLWFIRAGLGAWCTAAV